MEDKHVFDKRCSEEARKSRPFDDIDRGDWVMG
jgi:hypothetical protein